MARLATVWTAGLVSGLLASAAQAALVGQWTFNESTGSASDLTASPANGTLGSNNASALPGRGNDGVRRYVHFDQALQQYVTMGTPSKLNITGAYTLETWTRIPSVFGTFGGEPGIGKPHVYGQTYYSGAPTWGYAGGGSTGVSSAAFPIDQWNHVAVTYDNVNTIRIYLNGVEVNNRAIGANTIGDNSTDPFYVGTRALGNFLTGDVDEVRIWNEERSAGDISTSYNAGAAPNPISAPGSARGLWTLDDTSFRDFSGRNNHLLNNTGVTVAPGIVGNAAQFNGSQRLTVYSDDFEGPLTSFSTGAWIKVQGSGSDAGIIGDGGGDFPYDITVHNAATAYAYLDDGGNNLNVGVPFDTWTHLAHTFDGTTHYLYLNGNLVGTDSIGNSSTGAVTLPFTLGFVSSGFTGLIDEAFFTTDNLSETQIEDFMTGVPEPAGAAALALVSGLAMLRRLRR